MRCSILSIFGAALIVFAPVCVFAQGELNAQTEESPRINPAYRGLLPAFGWVEASAPDRSQQPSDLWISEAKKTLARRAAKEALRCAGAWANAFGGLDTTFSEALTPEAQDTELACNHQLVWRSHGLTDLWRLSLNLQLAEGERSEAGKTVRWLLTFFRAFSQNSLIDHVDSTGRIGETALFLVPFFEGFSAEACRSVRALFAGSDGGEPSRRIGFERTLRAAERMGDTRESSSQTRRQTEGTRAKIRALFQEVAFHLDNPFSSFFDPPRSTGEDALALDEARIIYGIYSPLDLQTALLRIRLFDTHLAIRLFRWEYDCLPRSLEELKRFDPNISITDPATGKPLTYRAEGDVYTLTSAGLVGVTEIDGTSLTPSPYDLLEEKTEDLFATPKETSETPEKGGTVVMGREK